jgi:3-oxoacyl-[acyl-carrier protein] reductase
VYHRFALNLKLTDKVAMIGGASKGLGFAAARALAQEGARVSIASRDGKTITDAAERIERETGAQVLATVVDVTSADAIHAWHAATVTRFGGVDLLLPNAGGPPAGRALDFDDRGWQSAFELLVLSVIRQVRLVVPTMIARGGGAILLSTSSGVKEPIANLALSSVLRASIAALAKTLALELAGSRIRVNHLIPGRIETARTREIDEVNARRLGITEEEQHRRVAATIPLQRYGDPEEFGRTAAFLLSDAAAYITGASLQVDGGLIKSVL